MWNGLWFGAWFAENHITPPPIPPQSFAILDGCVELEELINNETWLSDAIPSGFVSEEVTIIPSEYIATKEELVPSGYIAPVEETVPSGWVYRGRG